MVGCSVKMHSGWIIGIVRAMFNDSKGSCDGYHSSQKSRLIYFSFFKIEVFKKKNL